MNRFTRLFQELDATTRTVDKLSALASYFQQAPPADAAWALFFLTGRRIKRAVNTRLLRGWIVAETGLPEWLVDECHDSVGDLAETLALLLPDQPQAAELRLAEVVESYILPLKDLPVEAQHALVRQVWRMLDTRQRLVWHKLIMGEFRVGVARTLVARALAAAAGIPAPEMSHRLMGDWQPTAEDYGRLMSGGSTNDVSQPYPFFLAHPLVGQPQELGERAEWQVEWKWDGIRAQLIRRQGQVLVWSRGEELVTDRFPEVQEVGRLLPDGTVLDGEILTWRDERPLPFALLQRRIGRKVVSARLRQEAPVVFLAFDLLEWEGSDVRQQPLSQRRELLESLARGVHRDFALRISPLVETAGWEELIQLRSGARERGVEGLMLKRRDGAYGVGRPRGQWWKWKIDPYAIDAVLIYAQRGHGRRASLYTDYTFGVWNHGELVPIAKAYSGLTDEEIREVDRFVRDNTLEKFGPVRVVRPELVFELHFEGIQISNRHKAGLAVRFPRMARWRTDKRPQEADTLDTLRRLAM